MQAFKNVLDKYLGVLDLGGPTRGVIRWDFYWHAIPVKKLVLQQNWCILCLSDFNFWDSLAYPIWISHGPDGLNAWPNQYSNRKITILSLSLFRWFFYFFLRGLKFFFLLILFECIWRSIRVKVNNHVTQLNDYKLADKKNRARQVLRKWFTITHRKLGQLIVVIIYHQCILT